MIFILNNIFFRTPADTRTVNSWSVEVAVGEGRKALDVKRDGTNFQVGISCSRIHTLEHLIRIFLQFCKTYITCKALIFGNLFFSKYKTM